VARRLVLTIAAVLATACSPAASVAPTNSSPSSTSSPTPGQTVIATQTAPASGSCANAGLPDGRIAFTVGDGQANGIAVINADGSGYQLVVEPKSIAGQPHGGTEAPSWIGPGEILFDSNRNGGRDDWHVFTAHVDGADSVQITGGADGIEYHGALSSDGTFLVYSKAAPTGNPAEPFVDVGLFVADPDGQHERQLVTTPTGAVDEWPDISPDGMKIAFTRGHVGDDGGLFVVKLDGSGLTRIVPADKEPLRARWSADGSRIVFHSNGGRFLTESANVWVVSADGTGLRQVTFEAGDGQAFYPTWSPDDQYIVFVHHVAGSGTNNLAVVPSEGGTACTLWQGTSSNLAWESDWASPA